MTEERVVYNPELHHGIIHIEGRDFIITDFDKAALDMFPLEYRKVIASQTMAAINLISDKDEINAEGYRRGIVLLKLPDSEQTT